MGRPCPVEDNKCNIENCIYSVSINCENNEKYTYLGMSAPAIRLRIANHLASFKNNTKRNQTELSKQIHTLKDKGIGHNINFKVVEIKNTIL